MIEKYIQNINKRYQLGNATEHTFRGDLQQLIENLVPAISATNEPKRQSCGAPDYILTQKDIPVGFIEAKDIGDKDLKGAKKTGNKEQFDRYKTSLNNLIFTDYLDFHLYREGEFITKIAIGEVTETGIKSLPENFLTFTNLIRDFCTHIGQTIKSPKKLAEMMAGKARLLSGVIEKALMSDEINQENSTLKDQMGAFKKILIHDITPKEFADVYAQTIAYGMFAARLHDPDLETFSRQEAAELIPKSNPFLRKLFGYIAGPDIDDRIKWIVDNLVEIFLACNVGEILKNYGKSTKMEDPIIHFYETFLSEYDPKLRKARGVWYTPAPVVNFIVRAVDDILKTEFDLPQGLADSSKTKIKVDVQGKLVEQEVHKVQILDPAAGTGTFLAEVIKHIHNKFAGQQGIWSNYVETHLLPRLNGFELLMASYAMAHLQLDLLLTETGYKPTTNQRFRVYLTNSLEEQHPDTGTLFASWLSAEANEANYIKRDTPVMCIIGNPPYSGESANKGEWIMSLMEDYKKEPGGKQKLKEQNSKFINDDYVKFLRYGQHFIEKNGSGVLAFINPHGFLDNPTFRGMRWNLLKTYDKIYTIDLHGNAKKKETAPDGSADVNVFDIEQGVSINIFVKTGKKKANELGKVFHYDLFGKRELKYDFIAENSLKSISFNDFTPFKNSFLFKRIDETKLLKYNEGINPVNLFQVNVMGFQTHRDEFAIDFEMNEIKKRAKDLINKELSNEDIFKKYPISDNRDWKLAKARTEIQSDIDWEKKAIHCGYRPFDNRPCYFSYVMMDYPRKELIQNVLGKENLLIGIGRQGLAIGDIEWCLTTVSKNPVDANMFRRGGVNLFPLYLYPETNGQQIIWQTPEKTPNLNTEIVKQIAKKLGLTFTNEKETTENTFAPLDILDYIYAVLHSPNYREKYKEFLKIDFPRVPYPKDQNTFWQLVKLGGEIRQIHLLESPTVEKYITQYPIDGDNIVTKPKYQDGKVYINNTQYFNSVPEIAYNFYIGGYQPAQKWLKDRKDRKLEIEDIFHYQKIIVALMETDRLMKEIDKIAIE
ncbi:Adenine specific DNA methyltransferase [Planktothrix sp. PCC 11201]|uniref:type ISP restriction/modification enzyme n=1 Tax=Planktothrix sp. PCC 11201 TaxID=1729650 RepID=UPI0009172338|nr:type ISP restriction/modification enzyme [Planktothrix sp. PCC 11201]SKB13435.1 Adenine specific DNA methyltransferase [Planktothrix sp. PCC 11201]